MRITGTDRARGLLALAGCVVLLAVAPAASGAADPPDRAVLEQQLEAARAELDRAARQVADLSRELYGDEPGDFRVLLHGGPRGSMLGLNIAGAAREEGVEVVGVSPGGPAERAGLAAGDVVLAVDGLALRRSGGRSAGAQLVEYLRGIEPGRVVKVEYLRGGKRHAASVTTAPAEPPMVRLLRDRLAGPLAEGLAGPHLEHLLGPDRAFRALELVPMTPKLGQYFGTDRGLLVARAPEAKGLPLEEGDVLLTIDGRAPENPGHAFRILRSYQPGEKVKLGIMRQRRQMTLEATMPGPDAAHHGPGHPRMPPPPPPPSPVAPPAQAGPA